MNIGIGISPELLWFAGSVPGGSGMGALADSIIDDDGSSFIDDDGDQFGGN